MCSASVHPPCVSVRACLRACVGVRVSVWLYAVHLRRALMYVYARVSMTVCITLLYVLLCARVCVCRARVVYV